MEEKHVVQIDKDLEPILENFFLNLEKDLQDASEAITTHNSESLEKVGHKAKGACGSYGFKSLREKFDRLEQFAQSGKFDQAKIELSHIIKYLNSVEIELVSIDEDVA